MAREFEIHNRVYNVEYTLDDSGDIYVKHFSLNPEHQDKHRKYSKRIFESLLRKHNAEVLYLECWTELVPFYEKCGFIKWSKSCNWWGGYEMHLYNESYNQSEEINIA